MYDAQCLHQELLRRIERTFGKSIVPKYSFEKSQSVSLGIGADFLVNWVNPMRLCQGIWYHAKPRIQE